MKQVQVDYLDNFSVDLAAIAAEQPDLLLSDYINIAFKRAYQFKRAKELSDKKAGINVKHSG